jgi:integral membrane sensor domain MASE1
MNRKRAIRNVAILALFALIYFAAGKIGLRLAFLNASVTAVWPPTGIALGGLLVLGWRVWPFILLGAFLVNITTTGNPATSLGIALGNTMEGLVGAALVNRFAKGRHAFDRAQDVLKFAVLAAMVATMVSPTFGVTSLALGGFAEWKDFGLIWWTWWIGDAGSTRVSRATTMGVDPHSPILRRSLVMAQGSQ